GVDAGGVLVALALLRDLAGLGDQKAGRGALAIIFDGHWAGHHAGQRAIAGQRRHGDAVGKRDRAKLIGLEQFGRGAHVLCSDDQCWRVVRCRKRSQWQSHTSGAKARGDFAAAAGARMDQATPRKSRLPISTPLWRSRPWAIAAWKYRFGNEKRLTN